MSEFSMDELMAIATARYMNDGENLFIGTGLPMVAAYLAKATHAPDATLLFESGAQDPRPRSIAKAVGDPRLVSTARRVSGMLDSLMLLHGGRVDLGALGCAQIDRHGNINTTAIGPGGYRNPTVRLPGSGGANDIASLAKHFVVVTRHNSRTFVDRLDYVTSPGYLTGPGAREAAGLPGGGPLAVITDKAVFDFDPDSHAMRVASLHPGVDLEDVIATTGFPLVDNPGLRETETPDPRDLEILRTRIDPDGVYL